MKTKQRRGDESYEMKSSEGPSVADIASRRVDARRLLLRLLAGYALARDNDSSGAQKVA